MHLIRSAIVAVAAILAILPAALADDAACKSVRLADTGWTDLSATNAVASVILKGLGYEPELRKLSVPKTFSALKAKQADVFLGNWMPSQSDDISAFTADGSVVSLGENLAGAGYGLVVPTYVAEAGVKTVADLGPLRDKFRGRIYGIEPGNDGNRIVGELIANEANGLTGFELFESSEAAMLLVAKSAVDTGEWIVFLGWAPHPVMGEMNLVWLEGLEGSGFGPATVNTVVRAGYAEACPNAAKLLANLKFTLEAENQIMGAILKGAAPEAAAADWLKENPTTLDAWLAGVETLDGTPGGLATVKRSLGM
jgi:glycine betaine/proline transport system substrate-binding protein